MRRQSKARRCSPSPITTAPTSSPTRSTRRSTFNGSRVTTSPSTSATSAISAATKSFPCPLTRRRLPRPPIPFGKARRLSRTTPTAIRSSRRRVIPTPSSPSYAAQQSALPANFRRRQRRPARSLHRLFRRIGVLHRRRHLRLQRASDPHRKAHEPRPSGRLLYTYSHATDEQSAMGLFYNGNNPLNLRSGYGLSDFDRKHVINFTYMLPVPKFFSLPHQGQDCRRMGAHRLDRHSEWSALQRGRLLGSGRQHLLRRERRHHQSHRSALGCTPKQALTGASGATPSDPNGSPALKASCFGLPLLQPGALNGAIPSNDPYETNFIAQGQRNIFRQSWQRRADLSLVKTQITERSSLKYHLRCLQPHQHREFRHPDR
jgi:hypothetical protein